MRKAGKIIAICAAEIAALFGVAASLLYFGVWHLNRPSAEKYPVRGVDVSSYQGTVDWQVLAGQDLSFAFIKATEGSTFVDKNFGENRTNAAKTDLYVGAYHFFSFESAGASQAAHFIETVGPLGDKSLPPVIDVEYYGAMQAGSVSAEAVCDELQAMIDALTDYYGVSPILYVTQESYRDFVKDRFSGCPLWVRSVYGAPDYVGDGDWAFWQYSNRHRLDGYDSKEPYIDMNLYNGDRDAFLEAFGT